MRRIGCDVDGVLANFIDSYSRLIFIRTGKIFPRAGDNFPTEWYWERAAGIPPEIEDLIWEMDIKASDTFWERLGALPGAIAAIGCLNRLSKLGHDIFFITKRPGNTARIQTERWLHSHGFDFPTVLRVEHVVDKIPLVGLLNIDLFIDDNPNTVEGLAKAVEDEFGVLSVGEHIYLKSAPYNRSLNRPDVKRVSSVGEALVKEGLWV